MHRSLDGNIEFMYKFGDYISFLFSLHFLVFYNCLQ